MSFVEMISSPTKKGMFQRAANPENEIRTTDFTDDLPAETPSPGGRDQPDQTSARGIGPGHARAGGAGEISRGAAGRIWAATEPCCNP